MSQKSWFLINIWTTLHMYSRDMPEAWWLVTVFMTSLDGASDATGSCKVPWYTRDILRC